MFNHWQVLLQTLSAKGTIKLCIRWLRHRTTNWPYYSGYSEKFQLKRAICLACGSGEYHWYTRYSCNWWTNKHSICSNNTCNGMSNRNSMNFLTLPFKCKWADNLHIYITGYKECFSKAKCHVLQSCIAYMHPCLPVRLH